MIRMAAWFSIFLLAAGSLRAEVRTETVEYKEGDAVLEGYWVWDDAVEGRRPGVLVCHAWMGPGDHERETARRLARKGYAVLVADVYGKGRRPSGWEEAASLSSKFKENRGLLRRRAAAGLAELKKSRLVDAKRTAAIGFCFGGTTVLELARSGADVRGVVSFHGGLETPAPRDARNIRGKVLVLHGAADPYAPIGEVEGLVREMEAANVDYQVVLYGGAVHSFTDPRANTEGARYDPKAARRSWEHLQLFFDEIFR